MSPSACDVSVATVNWNGKDRLAELLPSLADLGCREVLVVDNGSQDGSVDFVRRRFPAVRVLENPVNQGFAQPCNRAAQEARGSVLAFINNDMRARPDWIESALPRLTAQTPCVASRILDWSGKRIDFNGSSLQYLGYALQRDIGELAADVSHDDKLLFPCGGAMLIDRAVFLETGGFDTDFFAVYEDVDLGWRLWVTGHQVAFAPDSIVYHRGHATFDKHPNQKLRYLMHRNALLTVLKNYDQALFLKILPLAVALAVKRAVVFSGVDKDSFYLWANTRHRIDMGNAGARDRLLDALNHLVAVDDVLDSLPSILEKRKRIQALRKRSDGEILAWFKDPLRTIVEDPEYLLQERRFLDCLDLESVFGSADGGAIGEQAAFALEERIRGLRRELTALRWQAGRSEIEPPPASRSNVKAFLGAWRQGGLRHACKRLLEHMDRGI